MIGATRWRSKHKYLRKFFGTFEDGSSGMFCNVIEVLYCGSTSEKLSVKARFDASVMLHNMIRYQHVLTAITYSTHHGDNLCTFKVLADLWTRFH